MSTYVMSDIHGCYDELNMMLEKIKFSDDDTLIIAGDYIDRGNQNYEMLEWVSAPPDNVILIKGNHDFEFTKYVELMDMVYQKYIDDDTEDSNETAKRIVNALDEDTLNTTYFDYYGTIYSLIIHDNVSLAQLKRWSSAIDRFPYFYKIRINDIEHIIVHAGYTENETILAGKDFEEFYLYAREEAYTKGGKDNAVIIAGHTPTISTDMLTYTGGKIFKYYDKGRNMTFYDIDCGAVFRRFYKGADMACLRLDDYKEFYLNENV